MRTVRRGTKQFERALDSATNIRAYSLGNGFVGSDLRDDDSDLIAPPRDWLRRELERFDFAKLVHRGESHYTLRVHGNLWYEFEGLS